jgi:hypothetical protein
MHRVTHLTIEQGVPVARSIAAGLQAVMAPTAGRRRRVARARHAWRYDDGTFMSYDDEEDPAVAIPRRTRLASYPEASLAWRMVLSSLVESRLFKIPSSQVLIFTKNERGRLKQRRARYDIPVFA